MFKGVPHRTRGIRKIPGGAPSRVLHRQAIGEGQCPKVEPTPGCSMKAPTIGQNRNVTLGTCTKHNMRSVGLMLPPVPWNRCDQMYHLSQSTTSPGNPYSCGLRELTAQASPPADHPAQVVGGVPSTHIACLHVFGYFVETAIQLSVTWAVPRSCPQPPKLCRDWMCAGIRVGPGGAWCLGPAMGGCRRAGLEC